MISLKAYKQATLLVKIEAGIIVVLAMAVVALGVAIAAMMPLKEKVPMVVEFDSGGTNFVTVAEAGESLQAREVLVRATMREYVRDRETVDGLSESERYPRVLAMSSEEVGAHFREVYGGEDSMLARGIERKVEIIRDSPIGEIGEGVHQVEFVTRDREEPGDEWEERQWVATIGYEWSEQYVSYDDTTLNPLGVVVYQYSLDRRREE